MPAHRLVPAELRVDLEQVLFLDADRRPMLVVHRVAVRDDGVQAVVAAEPLEDDEDLARLRRGGGAARLAQDGTARGRCRRTGRIRGRRRRAASCRDARRRCRRSIDSLPSDSPPRTALRIPRFRSAARARGHYNERHQYIWTSFVSCFRRSPRPLRNRQPARCRRDGRSVSSNGYAPRTGGGHQSAAGRGHRVSAHSGTFPAGSAGSLSAQPPQHLHHLRRRHRSTVHRDGVARRRDTPAATRTRPDGGPGPRRHRPRRSRRPGCRAQQGHRASRHQTGEHLPYPARPEDSRFRTREGDLSYQRPSMSPTRPLVRPRRC